MKKQIIFILIIGLLGGLAAIFSHNDAPTEQTYFTYPLENTRQLSQLTTNSDINLSDIYLWDQRAFQLVSSYKLTDVDASRVYAYLSVSQADFAALTHNATGSYSGDIDLISRDVMCHFFPKSCNDLDLHENYDSLTKEASQLVMERVNARIARDNSVTKPYQLRTDKNLWSGPQPSIGIDAMNRLPWHLTAAGEFRAPAPPAITSSEYQGYLVQVKQALNNITEDQRAKAVFWAGGPGTKTPPGIWLNIADQYMKGKHANLATVLHVHADLSSGMADAVIAVFDSKYNYQQKRPFMLDSSIHTVMPTPNHPSYPAGHATISGSAYTVLNHFFPENSAGWLQEANEASDTRVWAGLHFPIDNKAGLDLGQKVGEAAVRHKP